MKKYLSFLTSAVVAASCFCGNMTASAAYFSTIYDYGDLMYFNVDENDDGIYDYVQIAAGNNNITEFEVPSEIEGLPVKGIYNGAFTSCRSLKNVTIPDGVTYIGAEAFIDCVALESIIIKSDVVSIGMSAFTDCTALESIIIEGDVVSIGDYAFTDCTALESIIIPDSVTSIGHKVFFGCTSLSSITIPDSVTNIGTDAFGNCTNLESITIENPECEIYDISTTIPDTATIYGYDNSTAQAYAEKYERSFVSLGEYVSEVKSGDIDENGETDVFDAVAVAQYTVGKKTLTASQLEVADMNSSGSVDVFDAIAIAKMTV